MATTLRLLFAVCLGLLPGVAMGGKGTAAPAGKSVAMPASVAELRSRGPEGLAAALRIYDAAVAERAKLDKESNSLHSEVLFGDERNEKVERRFDEIAARTAKLDQDIERMASQIDAIGGQRSCSVSRLYWYTDLEAAKAASAKSGRPILSLRMLGKLTDEYSCANSRFFRTALYANTDISKFLQTNFVLHWQSVRPVPRVTIDFGDGRKLERTVTGNSAHHLLASDGTPIDVLPGLYSPLAFRQWAWDVANFYGQYARAPAEARTRMLQTYHAKARDELLKRWDFDIQRLSRPQVELASMRIDTALESERLAGQEVPDGVPAPKAERASKQAVGKYAQEAPVLRFAKLGGTWMERGMDDELWQAVADLHREDVKLDDASVTLMRREAPLAKDAAIRAVSKTRVEDPILRIVRAFEDAMTLDTVRNEYLLHRRIHEQFADKTALTTNVDALNEWVYAELFLTPSSDPWLGLAPRDIYTALDGDGRTEPEELTADRSGG